MPNAELLGEAQNKDFDQNFPFYKCVGLGSRFSAIHRKKRALRMTRGVNLFEKRSWRRGILS
jgi:hypothetical protein